jgi:hypothetical protein
MREVPYAHQRNKELDTTNHVCGIWYSIGQEMTAFRNPVFKRLHCRKATRAKWTHFVPCATFIDDTTFHHYALISAKISNVTSFIQAFQLELFNNLATDVTYLPHNQPWFNQPLNM